MAMRGYPRQLGSLTYTDDTTSDKDDYDIDFKDKDEYDGKEYGSNNRLIENGLKVQNHSNRSGSYGDNFLALEKPTVFGSARRDS